MRLSRSSTATFGAVMDALLPARAGPGTLISNSATSLGLTDRIPEMWALLPNDRARSDLRRLLRLLGTRAGGLLLYRKPKRFRSLTAPEAETALRRMASSRFGPARQGFQGLKKLTTFLLTTAPPGSERAAAWDDMGYPGPIGFPPRSERSIDTIRIDHDTTIETGVVIVGSGAGGGTAAGVLAGAGIDLLVLEKGHYLDQSDFTHHESTAYRDLYLDNGFAATTDGAISVLAGSNLGGGTTVNWTTAFATPRGVREEWDRVSGLDGVFTGDQFEESTQAVMRRVSASKDFSSPSSTDVIMERGMRQLGWHVDAQDRSVIGCDPEQCGYCGMGCRLGSKQGTLRTYLDDAARAGADIVPDCSVTRVLIEDDRAVGVVADSRGSRLVVKADAVVVAGSALSSPAVLSASGVSSPALGRNLRMHPVTAVWGKFEEAVDPWTGMVQTLHSDQFADLDGKGYGFRFETGPIHPALVGLLFGWENGRAFKELFSELRHWSPLGILMRDQSSGRVSTRRDGTLAWQYKLARRDVRHFRIAVARAAEALAAAGAIEVLSSTATPVPWFPGGDQTLDDFTKGVDSVGYGPHQTAYLSLHQMGSARMGRDPDKSVVDADNRVHGVEGLYVMDGSCFPTASGVNPMISIQAIAHRAATRLANRL